MSTALAIASVTQVLKDLLDNGLIDNDVTGILGGDVTVTCLTPDQVETAKPGESLLNLFMYHVSPNTGWRNERLPSINSSGERMSNPPLALDLHYILSAYSKEELHTEILLGYGMQLLHENPVLAREAVKRSLSVPGEFTGTGLPVHLRSLSTSKLDEQVELVKITPEGISTDEMSKLWTAFQSKYRPSAAYMATVVLIESSRSTKTPLPVRERNIYVNPIKQPVISKIKSQSGPGNPIIQNQKILHNFRLVIEGENLKSENLKIILDGIELATAPAPDEISNSQIIFQLPQGIAAGIHGLQVSGPVKMGTPEVLHRGVESNVEALILCPVIDPVSIEVTNVIGSGNSGRSAHIGMNVKPAIGPQQRILLLMNQVNNAPGTAPLAYSFQSIIPLSPPEPAEEITVVVSGVKAGTYLVRIQVDGTESPLGTDINGKYNSPLLLIP